MYLIIHCIALFVATVNTYMYIYRVYLLNMYSYTRRLLTLFLAISKCGLLKWVSHIDYFEKPDIVKKKKTICLNTNLYNTRLDWVHFMRQSNHACNLHLMRVFVSQRVLSMKHFVKKFRFSIFQSWTFHKSWHISITFFFFLIIQ